MSHIIDGEWQSDRYPTAPRDTLPINLKDPRFQDLAWEYAERWREEDPAFTEELQAHLKSKGYSP